MQYPLTENKTSDRYHKTFIDDIQRQAHTDWKSSQTLDKLEFPVIKFRWSSEAHMLHVHYRCFLMWEELRALYSYKVSVG